MLEHYWRDDEPYVYNKIKNNIADKLKELKSTKSPKQIIEEQFPGVVFIGEEVKFSRDDSDYKFDIRYDGYEWFGVQVINNEIIYDYYRKIGEKPKPVDSSKYVYDYYNK